MKTIGTIKKRLKSETPPFFQKIRNWAMVTGALAGFLITLPVGWPVWVTSGLTLVAALCAAVAGTSQLTTTEESIQNEMTTVTNNKNRTKWKTSKKL